MKKWLTILLGLLCFMQYSVAQQVNGIEYFFDHDTGVGKQISLPVATPADTIIKTNVTIPIAQLADGMHTMYIRARSDSGWSQFAGSFFFIRRDVLDTVPYIDSAEYFFDKDSGIGLCRSLNIGTAASTITLSTTIPINGVSQGFHTMAIRVKNTDGKWSHFATQMFYVNGEDVQNMPAVVSCEYFLDHDPGIGLGDTITRRNFTNPADTVKEVFNFKLPIGLDTGKHYMYMRVKDAAGHWSLFQDTFRIFTLPITGLTLSAEKRDKTSLLNWFTLTESNSNHFEVEKSTNSISFTSIGSVKAKGNSYSRSNYSFADKEPATGLNFYRIKEVDNDDKFTYSQIVKLWFDKGNGTLSIYPNPAATIINVKYESSGETAMVNLFDAAGHWVKMYRLRVNNNLQINISDLASGAYTIHISDGVKVETGKFVKQ